MHRTGYLHRMFSSVELGSLDAKGSHDPTFEDQRVKANVAKPYGFTCRAEYAINLEYLYTLMDPSTFLGSVWGMIDGVKYLLRQ